MTALLPMLWVWLSGAAMALQLQLRAEPTELQTGQTGSVRLLLVSTDRDPMSLSLRRPPALPAQKGLIPSYIGQSSQFQNVNGRVTRILQLDYRVAAVEPGEWSLGPVEIELPDGSHAVADPIRVKVVARSDETTSEPFTVSATFDHDRVWEGQTVVFATRFESRLAGAQVRWSLPNFDGLRSPQHGVPADERFAVDDPDGTITVRRTYVPLVAVATGTRDQGVAIAEVSIPQGGTDLFGFQRSRIEREVSDRLELTVDPLPPPPPSFSGLVGDFEINSRLDASDKVAVGQSVPWSVVITGDGVIEGLDLPTFEADGASIYDNGSDLSARMDGDAFRSTAAFRRVVVPTREGALQLPPFELTWFSPARGDYVTKEITLPELTVVPGREGDGTVQSFGADASPEASDPVAIDLRPVYTWGRATAPSLRFVLPPLLGLAAAPGALVLAGLGVGALARRRAEAQQARRGPPTAEDALQKLPSDPQGRLVAFDVALRRLEAPLQALPEEVRAPLAERHATLRALLGRLRFAEEAGDAAAVATLEGEVREIVRDVRRAGRKA